MTQYATDGVVGVDFTDVRTSASGPAHVPGMVVKGTDSTEWMYCQASGAVRAYDIVAIDENFQAVSVTSALAGTGMKPGFCQTALATKDWGWIATKGTNIKINVASSCAADTLLYVGTTGLSAGVADDASASGRVTLQGVVIVTANASSTTTAMEAIATSPIFLNI